MIRTSGKLIAQARARTSSWPGPATGSSTSASSSESGPPGWRDSRAFITRLLRFRLARRFRESRQLGDVGRLVLDDRARAEVAGNPVVTVHRRQRVGAIVVERRHAAIPDLLGEMVEVARQQNRPRGKPEEQAIMAGR